MRLVRALFGAGLPALLVLIGACATAPGPNCVRLSASGFFCLVPPTALPARAGTAMVTVTRHDTTHRFVGQLSISARQLTLALYNLAGVPAATLHWDGHTARIDAPKKPPMKARQLTALLELSLASQDTLDTALHGLTLATAPSRAGQSRRLMNGGTLVARAATRADGTMQIHVPRLDLDITLEPLKSNTDE